MKDHSAATPPAACDVLVIGGAMSGAATATLLLREQPQLRVVIVEKSPKFTRRVGEATVEVSTFFLGRVLGLTQYLNESHLVKQGLRFWFQREDTSRFDQCSEVGGRYLARVPAFQVDRSTLDEEILRRACGMGATLLRPASISDVKLNPGGMQSATVRQGETISEIQCRWVIDASGVAAFLARREGWWRPNREHPTTAVWSRWKGVKDWDGPELARKAPQWAAACYGTRGTATNHLLGHGWWAWCIPLKGGDVSIGVVFDQRLVEWPEGGSLGGRLKEFLCRHPMGAELLRDATWQESDMHWRKNLPYYSTTFAGDGFALVGDAAGFLDPFYSPGMDWISFTAWSSAQIVLAERAGKAVAPLVEEHNQKFSRAYKRWFEAVYKDKYEYMADYEFMRLAFLLDLGFYYLGVASQPFKYGMKALSMPVYSTPPSVPVFYLMRAYHRRFVAMARERRRRGEFGRKNTGERFMFQGYTFLGSSMGPLVKALLAWLKLEISEGWRTWWKDPAPEAISNEKASAPAVR